MSRIGKKPIEIPENVEITLDDDSIKVKGPKGELSKDLPQRLEFNLEDDELIVTRKGNDKKDRSFHGLIRSLIENMIIGVVDGYKKELEMVGVGYNAQLKGKDLQIEVGFSHPVKIEAPENIEFEVEKKNKITVKGIDKQQVGEVAAQIRSIRKPEPYKGKGIKYVGEHIRRKVGKTG
ncbi:MAG: 50S ribosomal protein L6 [Bacillota bacterium]